MTQPHLIVGQQLAYPLTFASGVTSTSSGAAYDPATIKVKWSVNGGTPTTWVYGTDAQIAKQSTGNYTVTFTPTQGGAYNARVIGLDGSGNQQVAWDWSFKIEASPLQ